MKRIIPLVVLFTIICSVSFAGLTTEQRVNDAQMIVDLFEHRYGPLPWKSELLGINHMAMASELLTSAYEATSDEEFFQAIALYLGTFQDAHVSYSFPSSYIATLGFDADDIGGNVIITYIERELLPEDIFPFSIGDRIIALDGISVDELRAELSLLDSLGTTRADARNAAQNLVWRAQAKFPFMPEGRALVTIEPHNGSPAVTVDIPWITKGLPFAPIAVYLNKSKASSAATKPAPRALDRLRSIVSSVGVEGYEDEEEIGEPPFTLWPDFMQIEDAPFFAGTFALGAKKIGFIRIETFAETWEQLDKIFEFLKRIVPRLQKNTDALILDLTGNGGGDLCYGEVLAGFFIDQPIPGIATCIKPTRKWVTEFEWALEEAPEDDIEILINTIRVIREALVRDDRLTEPFRLCSPLKHVPPATTLDDVDITYTKPLLILVNAFSASMGEIFPAMLQDPGRAMIFGTRTMGAGGNVVGVGPMGNSDIAVSVTESLVWRSRDVALSNGTTTRYIENVGVIPDYPYEVTLEDFLLGYEGYRAAIESALTNMINTRSFDSSSRMR